MSGAFDISALGEPLPASRPFIVRASTDITLRHARSVLDSLINGTLVPAVPGEEPTREQVKAAFRRLRYDLELAESQEGLA